MKVTSYSVRKCEETLWYIFNLNNVILGDVQTVFLSIYLLGKDYSIVRLTMCKFVF